MKTRLIIAFFMVMVLLVLTVSVSSAGTRIYVNEVWTLGGVFADRYLWGDSLINPHDYLCGRTIRGFHRIRVRLRRVAPATGTLAMHVGAFIPPTNTVLSESWPGGGLESDTDWHVYDWLFGIDSWWATYGAEPTIFSVRFTGDPGEAFEIDWYEIVDQYGDPAYELSLLESLKASWDSYLPLVTSSITTDTLTSGNVWNLDRSFTYDGILGAIVLAGLGVLTLVLKLFEVWK